jgi:hypothetical protein
MLIEELDAMVAPFDAVDAGLGVAVTVIVVAVLCGC